MRTPYPYQSEVIQWAEGRDVAGFLLDTRLGKTLCAIRWALQFDPPRLVVAPNSSLAVWLDELKTENQRGHIVAISELHTGKAFRPLRDWTLCNFEKLFIPRGRPTPTNLAAYSWGCVLIDESVLIANPQAKTTRVVQKTLSRSPHKAILSGLPNPENKLQLFEQIRFLRGSFIGSENFWEFRKKYFVPDYMGFRWEPKKGTKNKIRKALQTDCYTLLAKDAGRENKKVYERRYIDLPPKVHKLYKQAEREWAFSNAETKFAIVANQWLGNITGGRAKGYPETHHNGKISELTRLLTTELQNQSVVVWFARTDELLAAEKAVRAKGIRVRRIVGKTPRSVRHSRCIQFQKKTLQVLCIQIKCGMYSLNLSVSSIAVYFSVRKSFNSYFQSVQRIEHTEKNEPLLILHILAKHTIDEDIYKALTTKRKSSRGFLATVSKLTAKRLAE